jgi:hypothetical protein
MSTVDLFAISLSETAHRGLESGTSDEVKRSRGPSVNRVDHEYDESLAPAEGDC